MAYYNFKAESSSSGKAYYLGTYNSGAQIDITAKYSDYAQLTKNNFVIQPTARSTSSQNIKGKVHYFDEERDSCELSCGGSASMTAPNISYNSSTGKLSFSMVLSQTSGGGVWGSTNEITSSSSVVITAKVYLLPEIEAL